MVRESGPFHEAVMSIHLSCVTPVLECPRVCRFTAYAGLTYRIVLLAKAIPSPSLGNPQPLLLHLSLPPKDDVVTKTDYSIRNDVKNMLLHVGNMRSTT